MPFLIPFLAGADEVADVDDEGDDHDEDDSDYGNALQYAAEEALQDIGKPGVPMLCKALSDKNPIIREKIASILSEIPDKRAIPALVAALADPYDNVRYMVTQALIAIGSPSYDKVFHLLKHESLLVLTAAIGILPEVNRKKGIVAIIPLFSDLREEVWDAVYDSLSDLDPKPVSEMIAYLTSEDKEVVIGALNILVKVGDRTLIPQVTPLTRHVDEEICEIAHWCIEELSKEKEPPKIIRYEG